MMLVQPGANSSGNWHPRLHQHHLVA